MNSELPFVSVIIPVRNGEGRIEYCLDSLLKQDYPRDKYEIIIGDGMSTDNTVKIATKVGAKVISNHGLLVASGRNVAMNSARGEILAFTDDDCILPESWLSSGVDILVSQKEIAGVGGPTHIPTQSSAFSSSISLLFRLAAMSGYSVQSDIPLTQEASDLPGCNVMYKKEILDLTGGYKTDLVTCEDVDLNMRIKALGGKLIYSNELDILHNKRDTYRSFFRQIFRFSQGRVQLKKYHKEGLRFLHKAIPFGFLLIILLVVYGLFSGEYIVMGWTFTGILTAMFITGTRGTSSIKSGLWFPIIAITFVTAWSTGYWMTRLGLSRNMPGR